MTVVPAAMAVPVASLALATAMPAAREKGAERVGAMAVVEAVAISATTASRAARGPRGRSRW